MPSSKFILIYITNPTRAAARKIAKHLLKKKLIACANILPKGESFYFEERKLIQTTEYVLFGKTIEANFKRIKKEVEKVHLYKIPCIIKIPAESNELFLSWVKKELE